MNKTQTYAGTPIFGNFGLYPMEEDIDSKQSKENILFEFEKLYKETITTQLKNIGIQFKELSYYSPKEYNFDTDSIDLSIEIENTDKLKEYVISNKAEIQKLLDENKSYDGYIALTETDVDQILENIDDLDISVLVLLFKDIKTEIFKDDNMNWLIYDNLAYEETED